jgi:hypothetical protein
MAKYGTFKYGDARYGTGSAGPAFHLSGGGDITVHGQVGGAATLSGGGDITTHGQVGGSATLSGGGDFTDFIGKVGRTWGGYPGSEIDTDQPLLIRFEPGAGGEALTFPAPNDLRFDTEFPGGFKSLSCTIAFPAGVATPPSLTAYAQVRVVDRRTGSTIWYGQLTEPGLSVDAGQTYAVTAEGPQTATDGWREVYGLVDRDSGSWQPVGDFEPAQQSFSGSPFPGGDYPTDYPGYDVDPGTRISIRATSPERTTRRPPTTPGTWVGCRIRSPASARPCRSPAYLAAYPCPEQTLTSGQVPGCPGSPRLVGRPSSRPGGPA